MRGELSLRRTSRTTRYKPGCYTDLPCSRQKCLFRQRLEYRRTVHVHVKYKKNIHLKDYSCYFSDYCNFGIFDFIQQNCFVLLILKSHSQANTKDGRSRDS